jgi:hypothetical protein
VLVFVAPAFSSQVRHQRRDEVGLGRGGSGPIEEVDELAGVHALAPGLGLSVDVQCSDEAASARTLTALKTSAIASAAVGLIGVAV